MKCHFTYTEDGEKVFMPMCYSSLYSVDKSNCTCSEPLTAHYFEKERFNKIIQTKNESIKSYQDEIKYLHNVIRKLKNNNL